MPGFGSLAPEDQYDPLLGTLLTPDYGRTEPEAAPNRYARAAIASPGHMAKGMFVDLPEALVSQAKNNPLPGLRREDYTDLPASWTQQSQPIDPMIEGTTQAGMMALGTAAPFAEKGLGAFGGKTVTPEMAKELAVQRRNQGLATGKNAPGWDFKRAPEPETSAAAEAAAYENMRPPPEGYMTKADEDFIQSGGMGSGVAEPAYPSWHDALKGTLDERSTTAPAAERAAAAPAGEMGSGGGGPLGTGSLSEAQAKAARWAGERAPLEGIPGPLKIGEEHFVPGPIGRIHDVADAYMRERFPERPYLPPTKYHPIDPEHSAAIARAYEDMGHTPEDPATKASYNALIDETQAQYQALKKTGLKIEPIKPGQPDPYAANPRLAAHDVAENNHLWFYPTEQGFGTLNKISDNPMLRPTGEKIGDHELLANDMFRVVHDYFGHLKEGHGFRAAGEDNAWRTHSAMYSDLARPAMTSETRGQNSWVNYGPHGIANRKASAADTVYADQKVGLMPEWTMRDRGSPEPMIAYHGTPYAFDRFDPTKIGAGEGNQAYGHGLYFAEHSPVSEWYRHQLAARRDPLLEKYGLDSEDGARMGIDLANSKGDPAPIINDLTNYIAEQKQLQAQGDTSKATKNILSRSKKMIQYLKDPNRFQGHMYQVAIDQPPEHFLDWDAALKGQSQHVQDRVRDFFEERRKEADQRRAELRAQAAAGDKNAQRRVGQLREPIPIDEITGKQIYEAIGGPAKNPTEGYPVSAAALKARGIAGIKYMDQSSRIAGGGTAKTRNFVTFDAPRILKRYAIPGAIGAGGFGSMAPREQQ